MVEQCDQRRVLVVVSVSWECPLLLQKRAAVAENRQAVSQQQQTGAGHRRAERRHLVSLRAM